MFDINPDAHRFYLSDLERARAKSARRNSPAKTHRRLAWADLWSKVIAICGALILFTAVSGSFLF